MFLAWLIASATAAPDRPWLDAPAPVAATEISPGLAVAEVRPGAGEALAAGDLAVLAYAGWLDDGTVWDRTVDRPALPGLPPGTTRLLLGDPRVPGVWSEGLEGLRVGGVRQLVLTDPKAEGDGPRTLTMVFELVAVEAPPPFVPPVARATRAVGGMEAIDLQVGDGAVAAPGARVSLDYVLRLRDGTEVDSSWRWPAPFTFRLDAPPSIRWSEALVGMRAGGRRQVTIPAASAFGSEGRPPLIPPGADLVLTIDLREVGG